MDQYVYKITNDDGGAPCVHDGILSLAICKPRIRVPAGTFDWVFGFGGVDLDEKLIYIAEVSKKARHGSYYRDDEYAGRPDRIYAWRGSFLLCIPNRFHPDGKWAQWDIGKYPNYERAEVLLSTNFRYFGRNGTADYKGKYPAIATLIEALRRGERIHHSPALRRELRELREATWAEYPDRGVLGEHHRPEECGECPPDDDEDDSGPIPE
jgi:hypothetical protein